jgi:hypothetical protein
VFQHKQLQKKEIQMILYHQVLTKMVRQQFQQLLLLPLLLLQKK